MTDPDVSEVCELLRRLAMGDEQLLRTVLSRTVEPGRGDDVAMMLDRRMRALVRLAALLAADACTTSLRWAVELANTAGVDDETIVAVLVSTGSAVGAAQTVASAPRLALAMELDTEAEDSRPPFGMEPHLLAEQARG